MEILVDARAMVPPEPFESSMEALEDLQSGDEVILWLFRQPMPLFDVLKRNGYAWKETVGPENCFEYLLVAAAIKCQIVATDQHPQSGYSFHSCESGRVRSSRETPAKASLE